MNLDAFYSGRHGRRDFWQLKSWQRNVITALLSTLTSDVARRVVELYEERIAIKLEGGKADEQTVWEAWQDAARKELGKDRGLDRYREPADGN